jgi:hypothetical protein
MPATYKIIVSLNGKNHQKTSFGRKKSSMQATA